MFHCHQLHLVESVLRLMLLDVCPNKVFCGEVNILMP